MSQPTIVGSLALKKSQRKAKSRYQIDIILADGYLGIVWGLECNMKIPFVGKKYKGTVEVEPQPKQKEVKMSRLSPYEQSKARRGLYIQRIKDSR